jgi:hypothetical protein
MSTTERGHNPNGPTNEELVGVGECSEHGLVTERDGATIQFPTDAECHCGRSLEQATVATRNDVEAHT